MAVLREKNFINYNINTVFKRDLYNVKNHRKVKVQKGLVITKKMLEEFLNELNIQVLLNLKHSKYACCGGKIQINKNLFEFFKFIGLNSKYQESINFNKIILNKIERERYQSNLRETYFVASSFSVKIRGSKKLKYQLSENEPLKNIISAVYYLCFSFNKNRRLH
jgi:hypothetical protein